MGKKGARTTPTFIIPENLLGITVTDEVCMAIAMKIDADIAEVQEVHLQKMYVESDRRMIHAIVVIIAIPDGVPNGSATCGALTHKVDAACEEIVREVTGFNKTRRERLLSGAKARR